MPDTMQAPDPVAAELGYLRACVEAAQVTPEAFDLTVLLPRLGRAIASLEAVLARHQCGRIVILGALCPRHENHRHFSITSAEAADVADCPECAATVCNSCTGCGPQVRLDSCPDRMAISAALLGEGDGDV